MASLDEKKLSERDICTKYITLALTLSGWEHHHQIRKEVNVTDGRVLVNGNLFFYVTIVPVPVYWIKPVQIVSSQCDERFT